VKAIIQIPCFNEEQTLPATLADLPRTLEGIDVVEWLVVDDGSEDRTVQVARENGVDHIVSLPSNRGLASAFMAGIDAAIERGADIIVNTDADNQYKGADVPKLIKPILEGRAEMVVGSRPIDAIEHFSPSKKFFQKLGSRVMRSVSDPRVPDAPSGFRAFSRDAARRLNVFSEYTYTLETIIQAGQNGISVISVPIEVNGETRPSRLVKNIASYIKRSLLTMFRIFVTYRPMRVFLAASVLSGLLGLLVGGRFLYFYLVGEGDGHVQSVILSALLMGSSLLFFVLALLADLIAVNRRLLEKLSWRLGRLEDRLDHLAPERLKAPRESD